jgi:hypothetical protein
MSGYSEESGFSNLDGDGLSSMTAQGGTYLVDILPAL